MPTRAPDRGSATIYAAFLASLLTALAGAVLAFGSAVLARHRAGAAADLAALSAAVHADTGAPCDWARRVAAAQRVRLVRCACDGPVCLVSAAAGTPWGAATVTSRAGPADDPLGSDVVAASRPSAPRPTGVGAGTGTRTGTSADVTVSAERRQGAEADPARLRPAPLVPRAPPQHAPVAPGCPAVVVGVALGEAQPVGGTAAAAGCELGAALAGAVHTEPQQP
ncbi:flp pilus-assembly TadE/G-like family protein [Catenulispora sp. NF23]|uniref:Flp pilus-assembly TadE/G-like family protein n=1 Tax=Catenulispora pinistramenti TaxID=2705254 RepID=A0ABS5KIZ2_9ACTN|nr:flp pilus-assembly TadE/G-like family protein [Catenulispora pinistramenti]MBS2545985.1 flp pilus-assembly TadE/G-like family protein [Catenulispora pinistramenti]